MSKYSILPLISSILFLALGLISYLKNKKSKINITFALMCLTTFWWQGSWAILFNTKVQDIASILVRIGYSGIIFISITFYHFTIEFLNREKEKKLVWLSYTLGIVFLIFLWTTDLFIRGYYTFYWGYYPKANPILHPVYLAMLSSHALRILYLLHTSLKKKKLESIKRNQARFMFWAIFFYAFAAADFADNYGLEFYPKGVFAILLSYGIIGYTIIRHKLLDVHFVIRKTITNLLLVTITYAGILAICYPRINLVTLMLGFAFAFIVVVYIHRLKLKAEDIVTHILYKGKYDYLDRLEKFIEKMPLIAQEEDLLRDTINILIRDMNTEKAALLIHDNITGNYILGQKVNINETTEFKLTQESRIIKWLKEHKEVFILEEEEKKLSIEEINTIKKELAPLRAGVCVPSRLDSDLIGIIALGNKTTGEMYTHMDIELLERLGIQLAIALDYKRLEAQLRRKEEAEAVGLLAYEISHEMKNLLVPIKTFVQMAPEKKDDIEFMDSFRKLAETHVDVINRKVEDILHFAQEQRVELEKDVGINEILHNAALGLRPEASIKNIEIVEELSNLPKITVDRGLMVHVFNNLILNALDAMKERTGKVRVRSQLHPNPTGQMKQVSRQWIRIEVKDDGSGIPHEIMDKIFKPFVTTKHFGKSMRERGVGLGLAVVKKILDAHHAIISVNSSVGKGTTFVVDLPCEQNV